MTNGANVGEDGHPEGSTRLHSVSQMVSPPVAGARALAPTPPILAPGTGSAWLRKALVAALTAVTAVMVCPAPVALAAYPGEGGPHFLATVDTRAGFDASVDSVAVSPDGEIVAGGMFTSLDDEPTNSLARLHPDGTPDTNFNASLGTNFAELVNDVAVDSFGGIGAGGVFYDAWGRPYTYFAGVSPDGTPDADFGANLGEDINNYVQAVAAAPDGSFIVGGDFTEPAPGVARINADGTPDREFAANLGAGFGSFGSEDVDTVAVAADGDIVVGGEFTAVNDQPAGGLARLRADGTPDAQFTARLGTGFNDRVMSVAYAQDGSIVVGGYFTDVNGQAANGLARILQDGTPYASFIANTGAGFDEPDGSPCVESVAVDTQGAVIVGGCFTTLNGRRANHIARLNPTGTPDAAFSARTGSGPDSSVASVAIDAEGAIVMGGGFTAINGQRANHIARLNANGTPDSAFNHNPGVAPRVGVVSVAGRPQVGQVLTARATGVTGSPQPTLRFQWQVSVTGTAWAPIVGATTARFTVAPAHHGRYLRVVVYAVNGVAPNAVKASAKTANVVGVAPRIGAVSLTGRPQVAQVLTARATGVSGSPQPTLRFQWQISATGTAWAPIAGATAARLTVMSAHRGKYLRVVVSASNGVAPNTATASFKTAKITR